MNTKDLILELGVEEIPASYFAPAIKFMEDRLTRNLEDAHLSFERLKTWSAPRRLGLGLWGLADHQPDKNEEIVGPPLSAAYDSNGNPTRAATGFASGQRVSISDLKTVTTPKGQYLTVRKSIKGRTAREVLTDILPEILAALPFPKTMRWGSGEYSFVRPVHWLLAVLDGEVLPINFAGIKAGKVSYGHRFLHPGAMVITSPNEYETRLAEAHIQVNFEKRRNLVRQEIERVIRENSVDLRLLPDEELVEEVTNLLEEPIAIMGHFDSCFLELPLTVAITAMKEHQRYFTLTDSQGRLAPYFIAVNNIRARNMEVVRKGHERVLRARLDDARFYFNEDRKTKLSDRIEGLKGVIFHNLLGTSLQKVERFKALALYLADQVAPKQQEKLTRAANLCKCDLITGVVKEFPSLQGLIGREYARLDGEDPQVAEAIYEHYLPVRANGKLPLSTIGAILSVADKLDTICGCFAVGLIPSGTADPFALRRGALGILNIFLDRGWAISLNQLIDKSMELLADWSKRPIKEGRGAVAEFIRTRLKGLITERGVSTDATEAVLALYDDNPVAAMKRALALEKLKSQENFKDLVQVFKRVINIIKKFGAKNNFSDWSRLNLEVERNLLTRLIKLEQKSDELTKSGDFNKLINEIIVLRDPVDKFFEQVLVDDPDILIKEARIALLSRLNRIFEFVADLSRLNTN